MIAARRRPIVSDLASGASPRSTGRSAEITNENLRGSPWIPIVFGPRRDFWLNFGGGKEPGRAGSFMPLEVKSQRDSTAQYDRGRKHYSQDGNADEKDRRTGHSENCSYEASANH
jgi:hypothetical protein